MGTEGNKNLYQIQFMNNIYTKISYLGNLYEPKLITSYTLINVINVYKKNVANDFSLKLTDVP